MVIGINIGIGIGDSGSSEPYGPELMPNGGFNDGGIGWTTSGEATVNTGVGRIYSSSGGYSAINHTFIWEVGKIYKIEYDVTDLTLLGGGLRSISGSIVFPTDVGHHVIIEPADNTSFIMKRATSAMDISVDNISIKEVL